MTSHVKTVTIAISIVAYLLFVPLAVEAQQSGKVYRIGFLTGLPVTGAPNWKDAFRESLRKLGYVEGKNIAIEWRSHDGVPSRLPALVADLVRLEVDVVVASGSREIHAVKEAAATIPIVMVGSGEPVGTGLIDSLARPGGNVTGLAVSRPELGATLLDILRETFPDISRVAVFLWQTGGTTGEFERGLTAWRKRSA